MRLRNCLIAVAALAIAVPGFAYAQNAQYKVTGGGQVIADDTDPMGPGDTIAFTAIDDTSRVRGELQVVRTTAAGSTMEIVHGRVTCVEPRGDNMARFGGRVSFARNSTAEGDFFVVDVEDAGNDEEVDMIFYRRTTETNPCEDSQSGTELNSSRLARGNVTIHSAE